MGTSPRERRDGSGRRLSLKELMLWLGTQTNGRGHPGSSGNMSKATGRHLWRPDSELTPQAGLATSCGEEEGGEAGAQAGCGLQRPRTLARGVWSFHFKGVGAGEDAVSRVSGEGRQCPTMPEGFGVTGGAGE